MQARPDFRDTSTELKTTINGCGILSPSIDTTVTKQEFVDHNRTNVRPPQAILISPMDMMTEYRGPEPQDIESFFLLAERGHESLSRGHLEHALELYNRALHLKNATILNESKRVQVEFANILFEIGRIQQNHSPDKSLQAFQLCLEVRRMCLDSEHRDIGRVLYHMAAVFSSMGDFLMSLDCLQEALGVYLSNGPDDLHLFNVWTALGAIQQLVGRVEDAASSFQEAIQVVWSNRNVMPVTASMGHLCRCRGNRLQNVQDLNETVAYFSEIIHEDPGYQVHDTPPKTAPSA